MNKTITMNLGGTIFHIEEDAYEKLKTYLSAIRSYFNTAAECNEIMNDLEARIAEKLREKVSAAKQAVLLADIEQIIAVMGKPEDFASAHGQFHSTAAASAEYRNKRLFRDPDDKLLGGVCSGIGYYFNVDPILLRIAFAIAFFIFGTGLLLYILLWIIVPVASTPLQKSEMRNEKINLDTIINNVKDEFNDLKNRMNKS